MAKFVLLISSLHKAGSERVMVNLAKDLKAKGHEVTVVTQYLKEDEYPLPEGVKRVLSELTDEEMGSRFANFHRRFEKLVRIFREEQPDLILSFIGKNNVMALLAGARIHVPVVVSVRGDPTQEYISRGLRMSAFLLFRRASGVVLQTRESLSFFPKAVQNKCTILPNPLNENFMQPPFTGERERTITAVGRIDENKNHSLLLRAFAQVADEFPEVSLYIYGSGPDLAKRQEEASALGLSERVHFPGSTSDVAGVLYKTGLFVLPSDTEGMPNTLLEAMALGVPSIATNCPCGGPAEVIKDHVTGILVPVRDVDAMAKAIRDCLADPAKARLMGEKASAYVQETYAPQNALKQWETYLLAHAKSRG